MIFTAKQNFNLIHYNIGGTHAIFLNISNHDNGVIFFVEFFFLFDISFLLVVFATFDGAF